jgi:hypothetical protein
MGDSGTSPTGIIFWFFCIESKRMLLETMYFLQLYYMRVPYYGVAPQSTDLHVLPALPFRTLHSAHTILTRFVRFSQLTATVFLNIINQ